MGIPGFFRQLEQNHGDLIVPRIPVPVDYLLWDFNSILYNALHNFKQTSDMKWADISSNLLKIIHHEINETIRDYAPTKTLYLAIDGTAPVQKMLESRNRRSQRYLETTWWPYLQNSTDVWYPMKTNKLPFVLESFEHTKVFTTLEFTPGSEFYSILYADLVKYLPKMNKKWKIPEIVLDGPFTAGEAEQKFLKWVSEEIPENSSKSIYILSKDADLLVLPFSLYPRTFYILREIDNVRKYQELWGVQNIPRYAIIKLPELYKRYIKTIENTPTMFYDRLALTFFQGNDFVKPIWYLPSFWGKSEGILQQTYHQLTQRLTGFDDANNRWTFSLIALKQFFKLLALQEVKQTREYAEYLLNQGRQISDDENLPLFSEWITHLPFTAASHPWKKHVIEFLNELCKNAKKYPLVYWSYEDSKMMHSKIHPSSPEIPSVHVYLQSLQWTFEYYMNHGTMNWKTLFEQAVSPFPSQISAELDKYDERWLTNILPRFEPSGPVSPLEGFIMVMPELPNFPSKNYLPKSLHKEWEEIEPPTEVIMPSVPRPPPADLLTGHKWTNKNLLLHLPEWRWQKHIRIVKKYISRSDVNKRNLILKPVKFLV